MELTGKYAKADVLTDVIDGTTIAQIINVLNQPMFENQKIVIQPDCHAGKGCVIGFTSTYTDKIIPNLIGVDISCGMIYANLGKIGVDLEKLDNFIKTNIPSGNNVHVETRHEMYFLQNLRCLKNLKNKDDYFNRSIGTLGAGNHFCELDKDTEDNIYLIIHSGSRNLGKQVAEYYQNLAISNHLAKTKGYLVQKTIEELKAQGRQSEIQKELAKIKEPIFDKDLAYLDGKDMDDYLYDMEIVMRYANFNRSVMFIDILDHLSSNWGARVIPVIHTTIHNYVDTEAKIIRKGACRALDGEELIIPINMRDGSLICIGEGLKETNYSAPHGAGRIMSRSQAKREVSMEDYTKAMKDIYTTSVNISTLDESPFAYKNTNDIVNNLKGVKVIKVIKPIYNFKASDL